MESRDLAKRRFAIEAACEALEARLLLAHLARADWGDWARTIGLAQAHDLFPDIDGTGAVIVDIDTGFELEDPRFPGAVTTPAPLIGKNQAGVSFVDTTVDDVQGHGTFMVSQMLVGEKGTSSIFSIVPIYKKEA